MWKSTLIESLKNQFSRKLHIFDKTKFRHHSTRTILYRFFMFIPEMTCSLTVSARLGQISFINLDYCLLWKNARDQLELSISIGVDCTVIPYSEILTYSITCPVADPEWVCLNPLPVDYFFNILWKWNNLVSMRPNNFIFMEYLRKMSQDQNGEPPTLYTYEPPFQKSWIRPCCLKRPFKIRQKKMVA